MRLFVYFIYRAAGRKFASATKLGLMQQPDMLYSRLYFLWVLRLDHHDGQSDMLKIYAESDFNINTIEIISSANAIAEEYHFGRVGEASESVLTLNYHVENNGVVNELQKSGEIPASDGKMILMWKHQYDEDTTLKLNIVTGLTGYSLRFKEWTDEIISAYHRNGQGY